MTYTHCRGCGKPLAKSASERDGLCGTLDGGTGCAQRFWDWLPEARRDFIQSIPGFGRSPEWSVAIDQWLEATR